MDEIDFLKKVFKTVIISISVIFSLIIGVIVYTVIKEKGDIILILYTLMICVGTYTFSFLIFYILKTKLIGQLSFKYLNNKDIAREILEKYSPAVYSFLYNKKIESYNDYTATILNLECKKYLRVDNNGDNISIVNNNLDGLYKHEKYVMNCIMEKTQFDMLEFNKRIIRDLLQLDLIYSIDDSNKTCKNIFENVYFQGISIVFIILLIFYLFYLLVKNLDIMMMVFMLCLVILINIYYCLSIFNISVISLNGGEYKKYRISNNGKRIRNNVYGLKRFLREYTLIDKRELEYKELFENYIAYALSLGEAKVVEDFVCKNEKYRNLIYNKRWKNNRKNNI